MALNDTLSIDIARRGTIHIPAKQEDHGYDIICTILRNGENIVDASTDTATFRVGKPDNTIYYGDATVNSDNTVTIHVDDDGQMLAVPGFVVVDVTLNDGNGVVKSTQNFVLDVQAAPGGEAIPSWSVFVELEELVADAREAIPAVPAAVEAANAAADNANAAAQHSVRFDTAQTLTTAQQEQARENIGGASDEDVNDLKSAFTANLIHDTASGSIANFPDGAALPVRDLSVGIQPVQEGSGDPSPDNVRPITGWTAANVTRTGRNLFSYENITEKNIYRATVSQMGEDLNSFYLCGANGVQDRPQLRVASWAYVGVHIGFRVKEETAITVSCKVKNYTENCNGFVRVKYNTTDDRSGATVVNTVNFSTVGTSNISISGIIPAGNYVFFEFSPASKSADFTLTQYTEVTDFQLELGSTATAYEPYQGDTYSITFPTSAGTVYGGALDVTNGTLTVDRAILLLKSNVPRYAAQTLGNGYARIYYRFSLLGIQQPAKGGLFSHGVYLEDYTQESGHFYTTSTDFIVFLPTDGQTEAYLDAQEQAGHPVQICYHLATPIVIENLDPVAVSTLLGTNNVWADTGDTTVEYYADPTLYINRKIAAAVAAMS